MYKTRKNMPNIWGKGQLFSFSGIDGKTDWFKPLVLHTAKKNCCITVKLPFECSINIENIFNVDFDIVINDVIVANSSDGPVLITFANCYTIIGFIPLNAHLIIQGIPIEEKVTTINGQDQLALITKRKQNKFAIQVIKENTSSLHEDLNKYLQTDIYKTINQRTEYIRNVTLPEYIDAQTEKLLLKAVSVMKVNVETSAGRLRKTWTTPDRWPHRNMWLWDSAFHGIGFKEYDPVMAQKTIDIILEQVKDSGMLPHMNTPEEQTEMTQPPILSWATWEIYKKIKDKMWLNNCKSYLFRYLEWIKLNRDRNENYIPEWLIEDTPICRCGESGFDNSPLYDKAVVLDSIDFASYLCNDYQNLAKICEVLGDKQTKGICEKNAENIKSAVNKLLWSEQDAIYYSKDFNQNFMPIKTAASFLPLFAKIPSPQRAKALLTHLEDQTSFASNFPVPTTSLDSGQYCKDMWRGPTWININYLLYKGLCNYNFTNYAEKLKDITVKTVNKWYTKEGCLFEFYDSLDYTSPNNLDRKQNLITGNFLRPITDYNWTAALIIAMVYEKA